jgi:hypothetical protein
MGFFTPVNVAQLDQKMACNKERRSYVKQAPLILHQSAMGQGGDGDILYMFDSARVVDF